MKNTITNKHTPEQTGSREPVVLLSMPGYPDIRPGTRVNGRLFFPQVKKVI
jgi:hypothetical protein